MQPGIVTHRHAQTLTQALVDARPGHVLVDEIIPGAPLFITFGFVDWGGDPGYYAWGRLKKLEALTGQRFNKVLVRDRSSQWYQRGVPGLGSSVREAVATLQALVNEIRPSRVITLGESMGAYGAISYGVRLGADRIVAFGALAHLHVDEAEAFHETRWLPVLQSLRDNPPPAGYDLDLSELIANTAWSGRLALGFGTDPSSESPEAVCLDALHAWRLARSHRVQLHPFPGGQHAVTVYLKSAGLLDRFLAQHALDVALPAPPAPLMAPRPPKAEPLLTHDAVVVDAPHTGAPLLLVFAPGERHQWWDETRALISPEGLPYNRIFLRDKGQTWFQRGADGQGLNALLNQIRQVAISARASYIVSLGAERGAWGAAVVGMSLGATRLALLSPVSHLRPDWAEQYHDHRFTDTWRHLQALHPVDEPWHDDLLALARSTGWAGTVELACGTQSGGSSIEAVHHDAVHAMRLATLPSARLHPVPLAAGQAAQWLQHEGQLTHWLQAMLG